MCSWKSKVYFNSIFRQFNYSLKLYQDSLKGSFLKVGCTVEWEATVSIMLRSFGTCCFTELCKSSKCSQILWHDIKKPYLLISLPVTSGKSLSTRKLSYPQWWIQVFKILISIWKFNFCHWQQILWFLFLRVICLFGLAFKDIICQISNSITISHSSF